MPIVSGVTRVRAIAAAQTVPRAGDVAANVRQHVQLARLAAQEGVRVLVFPELSLTGYELGLADDLAFSPEDARLVPLVEEARANSMTLVAGAPVRIGSRLHIGAFIIAPDGRIDVYTKQRLGAFPPSASVDGVVPPAESTVFDAGDRDPLVSVDGDVAAVAICADIGDPGHARRAADRGAALYLASMFVIPSELDGESERLATYAARHRMLVGFANFGGPSGGLAGAGRSAVWSPRGEKLVQLGAGGSGLAIASETPRGWRGRSVMAGET